MSHDPEVLAAASDDDNCPSAGQTASEGFGERSLTRQAETASFALAEQAKASVQSRYVMALQRPRSMAVARKRLLDDCRRPAFAEAAIYNKPVGDGVEGPSIRMAEAAARAMGNVLAEVAAIYDDSEKRIVRVSATDLESNVTYPMDVTISKTIERSKPQDGRKIIARRKNSRGRDVYVIEATDEEILDKERATASKALRTCLLRLIPGDILEEAMEQCYRTRADAIKANLPEAQQKMVVAFKSIGVTAAQLVDYVGHAISDVTVEELGELRALYTAIKDKEATWSDAHERRRAAREPEKAAAQADALADRLANAAAKVDVVADTTDVEL
jgi:hypothetical protein